MNPSKLFILLATTIMPFSTIAQKANVESINKSLKAKQSDSENFEAILPDIRWGLLFQAFGGEFADELNITAGTYLKYKPFYRFDVDAGFKLYSALLDNDYYDFVKDEISYNYVGFSGTQFYLAFNTSLALDKLNSDQAIYTSIETGYASNTADLNQYDAGSERIASQSLHAGKMYIEWKLGINLYGDFLGENTGVRAYVGFNSVPYFLSAYNDTRKRNIDPRNYNSGMLLIGVAFEFGKKSAAQKANKKKQKENQSIIEKYQGKSDKLF